MTRDMYVQIEKHMLSCMNDGAHDKQHIYRVLYFALDIAGGYNIDTNVLIAASLLHDIGRDAQYRNPSLDHAVVGANMAYDYLRGIQWPETKAAHVKTCIASHRYRTHSQPESMEAKILFDADKLDVTGAMGAARTLAYKGIVGEPLYLVDQDGNVLEGREDEKPSFFHEYHWKLKKVYDTFYTERAKAIAGQRRKASAAFFENLHLEVESVHKTGLELLNNILE